MNQHTTSDVVASGDRALAQVVDELMKCLAERDNDGVQRLLDNHPRHAEPLRQLLPALEALAQLRDATMSGEARVIKVDSSRLAPRDEASMFHHAQRADYIRQRSGMNSGAIDETPQLSGSPLVNNVLGDYRIIREIGRGGMGIVYEAEQISLARRVALKILPFAAVLDPRHLQRFKNEALAAAHLDHPNIVEVYGVGCERGVHFYAMRFVEGQTLAEVIEGMRGERRACDELSQVEARVEAAGSAGGSNQEPLHLFRGPRAEPGAKGIKNADHDSPLTTHNSPLTDTKALAAASTIASRPSPLDPRSAHFFRTVAELGIQAAEALDHAHQMGIVHRDIKPSNLMLEVPPLAPGSAGGPINERRPAGHYPRAKPGAIGDCPKLWITDFGLAHIESDATLTMTGDLVGTLRYMSPEQAEGRSAILDHRTDIYSLGVTLYELLTLRPAFPAADRQTLLKQIAQDEPAAPRKVNKHTPADLETIILKSIAKDPHDRYASAHDLAADLARFINERPIAARPLTIPQRAIRWSRRHAGLVLAVSAVLLVLATAAGISTVLIGQAYQDKTVESKRADHAREQADARAAFAKQVVDEMYTKVARKWLANEPRMTPLQKEFLEKALAFYDELAHAQPTDVAARHDRAMAVYRTFEIQITLGRREDALERVEQAQAELAQVVAKEPDNPKYENDLANMTMTRGVLLRELGKAEEGLASIEEAIEHWSDLAERFPDEAKYRGNLADAQMNLGATLMGENPPESERRLHQAISTYRALIVDGVNVAGRSTDAARASINLATVLNGQKRFAEAQTAVETAIDLLRPLVDSAGATQDTRELLFGAYHSLGLMLLHMNRCAEALEPLEQATATLESLAADFPDVARHRERLTKTRRLSDKLRAAISAASESNGNGQANEHLLEELGDLQLR